MPQFDLVGLIPSLQIIVPTFFINYIFFFLFFGLFSSNSYKLKYKIKFHFIVKVYHFFVLKTKNLQKASDTISTLFDSN